MRRILLTLAALAAFGTALPVTSNTADAREVVIIKKHRDHSSKRRQSDAAELRGTAQRSNQPYNPRPINSFNDCF